MGMLGILFSVKLYQDDSVLASYVIGTSFLMGLLMSYFYKKSLFRKLDQSSGILPDQDNASVFKKELSMEQSWLITFPLLLAWGIYVIWSALFG